MNEVVNSIAQAIHERYGTEIIEFRGETKLIVPPEKIVEICQVLRDEFSFEVLAAQSVVDYWPDLKPRFHVFYELYSLSRNLRIELRVPLNGNEPSLSSVVGVYPNANWHEREIWDMFGVRFQGHPDLRRILMPYDWEGHPLRKDYPLGYEEVQFTFNFDEIDRRKPYAKE